MSENQAMIRRYETKDESQLFALLCLSVRERNGADQRALE